MTGIYDQFDKAFSKVSAYVIFEGAQNVGRIAFKRGDSRTTCYAQVWGAAMAAGHASGHGYDKTSAAAENAIAKLVGHLKDGSAAHVGRWKKALDTGSTGERWARRLETAGYTVAHVID